MSGKISKKRVFDIIQIGYYGDWQSKAFDVMVIVMILMNLFIAVFQTFEGSEPYHELLAFLPYFLPVFFLAGGVRRYISGHDRRARLRHHHHLPGGGDGGDTYGYLVCRIRGALYQDKDDERGIGGE